MIRTYYLYLFKDNKELLNIIENIPKEYFSKMKICGSGANDLYYLISTNTNLLLPFIIENYYYLIKDSLHESYIFEHLKNISYELCLDVVKKNSYILDKIPKEFHSPELYYEAIKNNNCIKYVHDQTEELCWLSLKINYTNILYINSPSTEMCFYAINLNGNSIYSIGEKYRTFEMYKKAIEDPKFILSYCDFEKEEIFEYYIETYLNDYENRLIDGYTIKQSISTNKYPDIYIRLIKLNRYLLLNCAIPDNLYDYVYDNNKDCLEYLSCTNLSEKNILRTLELCPGYIFYINNPTDNMINLIINMNCEYKISFIKDEETIKSILSKNPEYIKSLKEIPLEMMLEYVDFIITNNPDNIVYVDRYYQTLDICIKAIEHNPENISSIFYNNRYIHDIVYKYNPLLIIYFQPLIDITINEIYKYLDDDTERNINFVYWSIYKNEDNDKNIELFNILSEYLLEKKYTWQFKDYLFQNNEEIIMRAVKMYPNYFYSIDTPTVEIVKYIYELDNNFFDGEKYRINDEDIALYLVNKHIKYIANIQYNLLTEMKNNGTIY